MWPDRVSNPGPLTYESSAYQLRYFEIIVFDISRFDTIGHFEILCWRCRELSEILIYAFNRQSAPNISEAKLIPNYRYLKVNFLVPENLLRDISSLRQ